jgi:hypothetical protein
VGIIASHTATDRRRLRCSALDCDAMVFLFFLIRIVRIAVVLCRRADCCPSVSPFGIIWRRADLCSRLSNPDLDLTRNFGSLI